MGSISLESIEALIPAVRQAAFDPERWNDVLEDIRRTIDLGVLSIVAHHSVDAPEQSSDWNFTTWNDPDTLEPYVDHYYKVDPTVDLIEELPTGIAMPVQQLIPEREWVESEFYRDFQSVSGMVDFAFLKLGGGDGTLYEFPAGDIGRGGVATTKLKAMELLAPHVMEAIETNTALGMAKIDASYGPEGALEQLGTPSFVLDADLEIVAVNNPGTILLLNRDLLLDRLGRLALANGVEDRGFQKRIVAVRQRAIRGASTRFHERRSFRTVMDVFAPDGAEYRITFSTLPPALRRQPLPGGGGMPAILILVDRKGDAPLEAAVRYAERHRLSPAERDVLVLLAEGIALPEAAERLGRSYHTVRAQLRSVFDKTGIRSQRALISEMLGGAGH